MNAKPLDLAESYADRGWSVIPVPPKSKIPVVPGWQKLRLKLCDLPNFFNGQPQNIGVLLGEPSNGLVDVDLDCPQAIALAGQLLPPTDCTFGRLGKPRSHWLYYCDPLNDRTTRLQDVKTIVVGGKKRKVTLAEFRATGAQTVFPGSVHESGEPIEFAQDGPPATIDGALLLAAVKRLAAAALLARHWPGNGSRHDAANALAGGLARARWVTSDIVKFVGAVAQAAGDEEHPQRRDVAKLTGEKFVKGERVTGWPSLVKALDGDIAGAVVNQVRAWLGVPRVEEPIESTLQESPEPSAVSVRKSAFIPFPTDALPDPMRDFVAAVTRTTGTDAAFAALAAITVGAGCVGNRAVVTLKNGWSEPCILWAAIVGKSGSIKSPVLKAVTHPLVIRFREARKLYDESIKLHEIEVEHHKLRMSIWKQSQRGDEPETDPPSAPQPPTIRRVLVGDVTLEKLACLANENPLGLILVRDELASWVGSFDRYSAGKGGDQPGWLSIYDAAPLVVDRKSDGTIFVERPAVSVLGTIQPRTLKRYFGQAQRESGLLARLIVVHPPSPPPRWSDAEISDAVALRWASLTDGLLRMTPAQGLDGEQLPHVLRLSDEARRAYVAWHDQHSSEMEQIDDDDLLAHYSKLKGIVARLALLFACVDSVAEGTLPSEINHLAMTRAVRVGLWLKHEASRVYGGLNEDEREQRDRELVELIHRNGGRITVRHLLRTSRKYRNAEEAHASLMGLVKSGVAKIALPAPSKEGGRPSKVFILVDEEAASNGADTTASQAPAGSADADETSADDVGTPVLSTSAVSAPRSEGVVSTEAQGADVEGEPTNDLHDGHAGAPDRRDGGEP